jgi:transcriptional regulator with XRE-family HTH domain
VYATIPELLSPISEPDPKTTLRELREYFAGSYEALGKLAAGIGISHLTLSDLLAGESRPTGKTLAKVQAFLEAEAKRNAESEKVLSEPISEATAHCV